MLSNKPIDILRDFRRDMKNTDAFEASGDTHASTVPSSSNRMRSYLQAAFTVVCACLIALSLAGCSTPLQEQAENLEEAMETKPLTSSEYMSQINLSVEKLNERLESFVDAVSREDTVTMRTQADSAFAVLDEMAAIEAPEELKDLRTDYINGCDKLKGALSDYISLYTEIATATSNNAFDYSTYANRIEEIQNQYNEGVQALQDADSLATDL